jgi:hypothetical protein
MAPEAADPIIQVVYGDKKDVGFGASGLSGTADPQAEQ